MSSTTVNAFAVLACLSSSIAAMQKMLEAMPDMTADELEQVRRYIIHGEGTVPVRKWRERKPGPRLLIGDRHEEPDFQPLPPAA